MAYVKVRAARWAHVGACIFALGACSNSASPPAPSPSEHQGGTATVDEPPGSSPTTPGSTNFRVAFAASSPPTSGGAGGGSGGGPAAGGSSAVLQAPFGTSTSCGDAIVGDDEECDDGDGGSDGCTALCRTRDQSSVAPSAAGTDRYLGAGRHPIAGLDGGFIATFTELPNYPASDGDSVTVAGTLFDIWGRKQHHVTISDGALPVDEANPVAAALPGGDYAVAWSDFDNDGSALGIALRKVKSDGTIGALSAANVGRAFSQRNPDMIWTGSQLVVSWEDYANAETGPDIRYRLFDANLNPLSSDLTLAESSRPEGAVALARFAGGWAAAYREEAGAQSGNVGQENVVVCVGDKTFRIGPFLGGPADDHPAVGELDATHLLVVVSAGTDPLQSGVFNVPRLRYAIVDTESTTTPLFQALEPLDRVFALEASASLSSPALAQTDEGLYLAWRSEARPGDPAGDQAWLKRVPWHGQATPPRLDTSEPEVLIPRGCEGSVGDQRTPAMASVGLPPHGALAMAWTDYAHAQGPSTGEPDVVVHYAPLHARDGSRIIRESWTGANGSAWPARWTIAATSNQPSVPVTVDIQNNEGRFVTTTNTGSEIAWINTENALNVDLRAKVRLNRNAVRGGFIARRADEDPDSYLGVVLNTNAEPLKLFGMVDGTSYEIASQALPPVFNVYAQGVDHILRFRAVTNSDGSIGVFAKLWIADMPEPSAWTISGVVPGTGASAVRDRLGGRPGRFGLTGWQNITNRATIYDDFQAVFFPGAMLGTPQANASLVPPLQREGYGSCCADNSECAPNTVCTSVLSTFLGLPSHETACVPAHCTNKVLDADETRVDCGGSDCAPCTCTTTAALGTVGYCTQGCPCGGGGVDCATSLDCLPGFVCINETAYKYGFAEGLEACLPLHCVDRVKNADEVGPDWGGSCGSQQCFPSANGGYEHCTVSCPCPRGGGDCDFNDQCQAGLECRTRGPSFGVAFNVCVAPHCANNVKDADETGKDCGGADCGPICP